jgi:hypothetical protein
LNKKIYYSNKEKKKSLNREKMQNNKSNKKLRIGFAKEDLTEVYLRSKRIYKLRKFLSKNQHS